MSGTWKPIDDVYMEIIFRFPSTLELVLVALEFLVTTDGYESMLLYGLHVSAVLSTLSYIRWTSILGPHPT